MTSAFYLTVKPGKAKQGSGVQHDVKVHWDGTCYVPTPDRLEIAVNDYVIWHCERMVGSPPIRRARTGAGRLVLEFGARLQFRLHPLLPDARRREVPGERKGKLSGPGRGPSQGAGFGQASRRRAGGYHSQGRSEPAGARHRRGSNRHLGSRGRQRNHDRIAALKRSASQDTEPETCDKRQTRGASRGFFAGGRETVLLEGWSR